MGLAINFKVETALVDRTDNTNRFYRDVRKYKPLTREDEIKYFTELAEARKVIESHSGFCKSAELESALDRYNSIKEKLILHNQRLVIASTKKYATTDTLTDYINEANMGLFSAIDKFDVNRGVKFSTFAVPYILTAINAYKYGTDQLVRKTNLSKTFHVVTKCKNDFIQKNEREPTNEELMEVINARYKKTISDHRDLLDMRYLSTDIDETDDESEYTTGDMMDYMEVSSNPNDCEKVHENEFSAELASTLMNVLDERERKIIEMSFGLDKNRPIGYGCTNQDIGAELGITPERVGQIARAAMKKMRKEYKSRVRRIV